MSKVKFSFNPNINILSMIYNEGVSVEEYEPFLDKWVSTQYDALDIKKYLERKDTEIIKHTCDTMIVIMTVDK